MRDDVKVQLNLAAINNYVRILSGFQPRLV